MKAWPVQHLSIFLVVWLLITSHLAFSVIAEHLMSIDWIRCSVIQILYVTIQTKGE